MVGYNDVFYFEMAKFSSSSAKFIVPLLLENYKVNSVVDFGCGDGQFISEFLKNGLDEVVGIEGSWIRDVIDLSTAPWLKIADLSLIQEFNKKFDLAICLEVAEHLESEYASNLITTLTNASDLVFFSAAIPGQSGTNHVNLQYPDYWASLFWERGFVLVWDPRKILWANKNVAPWYQQNCLLFAKSDSGEAQKIEPALFRHPDIFPELQTNLYKAKKLPKRIQNRLSKNFRKIFRSNVE